MSANPPLPFSLGSVITDTQKGLNLRLLEALGSGSYAIVYKAQALHDGQFYALKCISKMDISNEDLEVQKQEIEIHRSLVKSSRIARLVSHFETEQYLFLVLEYIQGMDLYWWILHKNDHYDSATGRNLDTLERLTVLSNLFVQCLEAVHFIHTKRIAHRDLKPENFLITLDQSIKLIDFGLATTEHYPTDFDCGSKPYMSFECHNPDNPHYDAFQADIWSLGIIFINLFWHRSPWSRPDNSCPAYKSFTQHPTDFLVERFDGMSRTVATFLSDRVFCSENKGRVKIAEWKAWCKNLVKLLSDDTCNRLTTPKKTIGFLPLTISLSNVRNNSAKAKESALSARLRRSSFFSMLPPSPILSPGKRGHESNDIYFPSRIDHQYSKSWSQELDFDAEEGEMDFSEPISFADTPQTSEDETKKEGQDDNDSGFGSDEPDSTAPQSFLSPRSPAAAASSDEQQPMKTVPKYIPPAKRRNHIPDIRGSSKRYSISSTQTAQPSSVGGQGYHVGAHQRRPFAPPQPTWRHRNQQQQRHEPWQKSNHPFTKPSNGMRNSPPSLLKTNDKIPAYPVLVYTPPHRTSKPLASASVSLFNNRMPGMTTHKSLADSSSVVQDYKPAAVDDMEMSEMDVVFGETPPPVERRNHLTKGAISDFGKLLRSIARDRSQ